MPMLTFRMFFLLAVLLVSACREEDMDDLQLSPPIITAFDDTLFTSIDSFASVIISGAVGLHPESAKLDSCAIYYNGQLASNGLFIIDGEFLNSNPFPIPAEDNMYFFNVFGFKAPPETMDTFHYEIELKDEKGLIARSQIVVYAL